MNASAYLLRASRHPGSLGPVDESVALLDQAVALGHDLVVILARHNVAHVRSFFGLFDPYIGHGRSFLTDYDFAVYHTVIACAMVDYRC